MNDYVLYAPEPEQLSGIKHPELAVFCELWKELPPLDFKKRKIESGDNVLCADSAVGYVWVPPSTTAELSSSRILRALGYRSGQYIRFFWVEAQPKDADYASLLVDAKAFNVAQIAAAKEREGKRPQKEEKAPRKKKKK
jgi:hypothetical protein